MPFTTDRNGNKQLRCDVCGRVIRVRFGLGDTKLKRKRKIPDAKTVTGIRIPIVEEQIGDDCYAVLVASPFVCSDKCLVSCYLEPEKMKTSAEHWAIRNRKITSKIKLFRDNDGFYCACTPGVN